MPQKRSRSSRRDFLKGRSIWQALQDGVSSSDQSPASQSSTQSVGAENAHPWHYLEHYSKSAMACEFEFLFNLRQYPQAGQSALQAFELIDQLEDQLSIYRDHSEVSRLNANATAEPLVLEPQLFELLAEAQAIHRATGAAFDITAKPLKGLWGSEARAGRLPSPEAIAEALKSVGTRYLQLNSQQRSVRFARPETEIDLGGIGKGYALDRVAQLMTQWEINDWILHGGQSSVIARGNCMQRERQSAGWPVGLTHPTVPEQRLAEIILRDRALGTSGTARQGFYHQGRRYGHIIDPRTGWPTHHCLATTVVADSAALSDALATAFFVMTVEEVEAFCQSRTDVSAILVLPGAEAGQIELVWFNLDDDDWQRM